MDIRAYAKMGLEAELVRLDQKRAEVVALLSEINGRPTRATVQEDKPAKRNKMSAEGRQRIREAMQRRWAKVREAKELEASPKASQRAKKASSAGKQTGNRKK